MFRTLFVFSFIFSLSYLSSQPLCNKNYDVTVVYESNTDCLNNNFNDVVITSRLKELNFLTPIPLEYNEEVLNYIKYFLTDKRDWLINCISLSSYYFPIFESYLDKYQLPLELKYIAVIESGLDPFARSKSGAVGLWQFLYPTSQLLNLKVNSFIDERQDPYKSTEAACRYLEYLYNMFNDWLLAIAAYNAGPNVVKNAIIRSGNKNSFWEIRKYLSIETQNYVPAFIAINYLMNYYNDYNLDVKKSLYYYHVDTIMIDKPLYFKDVSAILNIPIEVLRFYNPQYKRDYIPYFGKPVPFIIDANKIAEFIKNSNVIFNSSLPKYEPLPKKKLVQYTVKKGDYLTKLSIAFRCSPDEIKLWNNLSSNELTTGTVLNIWTYDDYEDNLKLLNSE